MLKKGILKTVFIFSIFLLFSFSAISARPNDPIPYPTISANFERTGEVEDVLKLPLKLEWKTEPPSRFFYRAPIADFKNVFIRDPSYTNKRLYAFDLKTGKENWSVVTDAYNAEIINGNIFLADNNSGFMLLNRFNKNVIKETNCDFKGAADKSILYDNIFYLIYYNENEGCILLGYDVDTGTKVVNQVLPTDKEPSKFFNIYSQITAFNGKIIFMLKNKDETSPLINRPGHFIYCFDTNSKKLLWYKSIQNDTDRWEALYFMHPFIIKGKAGAFSNTGYLHLFDLETGEEEKIQLIKDSEKAKYYSGYSEKYYIKRGRKIIEISVYNSPAVAKDRYLFIQTTANFKDMKSYLIAFDIEEKKIIWDYLFKEGMGKVSPIVSRDVVFSGTQGDFYSYGRDFHRDVKPYLVGLDIYTGKELWRWQSETVIDMCSYMAISNGRLIASFSDGVRCFVETKKSYRVQKCQSR